MNGDFDEIGLRRDALRRVCLDLIVQVEAIAVTLTDSIRAALPVYVVVPPAEHRASVAEQLRIRLRALAEHRRLDSRDLAAAQELAERRAAQGIPIDALIAAYQAGDQAIWHWVVDRSGSEASLNLSEIGHLVFEATAETTEVMARAHSRVWRAKDESRFTLAHQFLGLLHDEDGHAMATVIGTRLGLDTAGVFTGLVWRPRGERSEGDLIDLEPLNVVSHTVVDGGIELVSPVSDPSALVAEVSRRLPEGVIGVGVPRLGLAGAALSLADARLAAGAAGRSGPVVDFSDDWLGAILLAEADRIERLIDEAVHVARTHRSLADTVMEFARCDMSIAAAAPRLHIHANTLSYRLRRWSDLTGLDARTFDGLSKSVVACRLAEREAV